MADLDTILDTLVESQAQKTASINEGFDAMSPAALFGRRATTSAALTWGYYGGVFVKSDGTLATIPNGTLSLPASSTVYVEVDGTGTVSQNTSGFTAGRIPLYTLTTSGSTVTDYIDKRSGSQGSYLAYADSPAQPVAFPMFIPGAMSNGQLVFATIPAFAVTIPAGLTGTTVRKSANPAATTTITLKKNGTSFGTIAISNAGVITLTSASGATFNGTSDELTVEGPATADASLTNLGITLKGTR